MAAVAGASGRAAFKVEANLVLACIMAHLGYEVVAELAVPVGETVV